MSIFVRGELKYIGEVEGAHARDCEIQRSINIAESEKLPLISVIEDFGHHWKGHIAFKRSCEIRGRWIEWFDFHRIHHVDIEVEVWRDGIYGKKNHRGMPREQLKKMALMHARKRLGIRRELTHNEAESGLMGLFAMQYPPVLKHLKHMNSYPESRDGSHMVDNIPW